MIVLVLACLAAITLRGQSTIAAPTNDEARSACLTLEHLLVIARDNNHVQDAAALTGAYKLVRAYVTDSSSVSGADKYVDFFLKAHPESDISFGSALSATSGHSSGGASYAHAPGGASWYGPPPSATLGRALDTFPSDTLHQSGVLVYGKNGSVENLHLQADPDSVTRLLKNNGAVKAEPFGN
jgi:hypothetical protein